MGFLNGIFGTQPAAAPAPAAPAAPAAPTSGAGPVAAQKNNDHPANVAADPANMNGAKPNPNPGGPEPMKLDSYADMFKPKPADPNAPKQPTLADPLLTPIDPAAFKQQVSSANFAAAVPQELMAKAVSGDPAALMEAMNIVGREAFAAATTVSHGLAEHGARTAAERVNVSLDGRIRQNLIRSQNTTNEVLARPAVAPVFQAVKSQLAIANPQLSPEEIQTHAEQYFLEMSNEITAPQRQAEQAKVAETNKKPNFAYLLDNN